MHRGARSPGCPGERRALENRSSPTAVPPGPVRCLRGGRGAGLCREKAYLAAADDRLPRAEASEIVSAVLAAEAHRAQAQASVAIDDAKSPSASPDDVFLDEASGAFVSEPLTDVDRDGKPRSDRRETRPSAFPLEPPAPSATIASASPVGSSSLDGRTPPAPSGPGTDTVDEPASTSSRPRRNLRARWRLTMRSLPLRTLPRQIFGSRLHHRRPWAIPILALMAVAAAAVPLAIGALSTPPRETPAPGSPSPGAVDGNSEGASGGGTATTPPIPTRPAGSASALKESQRRARVAREEARAATRRPSSTAGTAPRQTGSTPSETPTSPPSSAPPPPPPPSPPAQIEPAPAPSASEARPPSGGGSNETPGGEFSVAGET